MNRVWEPDEARAYTRWLATHHYENFHVVSFLLPKRLHQDFYNVYSFCRWADDLGDEIGDTHLHERARDCGVESLGNDNDRRPGADPSHQAFERAHVIGIRGVEVDDHDSRAV